MAARKITMRELCSATDTKVKCWQYLRSNNLLASVMQCSRCGSAMREEAYGRSEDSVIWRCPRRMCRRTTSIRKGSFFEGAHIPLQKLVEVIYWWTLDFPNAEVQLQVTCFWLVVFD